MWGKQKYSMISLGIWLFNEYQGVAQSPTNPSLDFYIRQSQNLLSIIKEQQLALENIWKPLRDMHIRTLVEESSPDDNIRAILIYLSTTLAYHSDLESKTKMSMVVQNRCPHSLKLQVLGYQNHTDVVANKLQRNNLVCNSPGSC